MSTHHGVPATLILLMAAALAACGPSSTPSPAPPASQPTPRPSPLVASPSTSPAPAESGASTQSPGGGPAIAYEPGAAIWHVEFARDGRIAVVEVGMDERAAVVMLDAQGRVLPGWPWKPSDPAGADPFSTLARVAFGEAAPVYVLLRTHLGVDVWRQQLYRLDSSGQPMTGFPVELPPVAFCDLLAGEEDVVYVACESEEADDGAGSASVVAVAPDGKTVAGWPVTLDGYAQLEALRPDGGLVLSTGRDDTQVTVLARDGSTVAGWPRAVAPKWAHAIGGGVQVDQEGLVRITTYDLEEGQCGAAQRTTYLALGLDGETLPGWPVTRDGWASEPAIAPDGSATIVTQGGRAIRYDLGGDVMDGWPVSGVEVSVDCGTGSPVVMGPGGRPVVMGDREVTTLDPEGRITAGWPVDPPGSLLSTCEACTPGPSSPMAPALGSNGIFVATMRDDRAWVVGIDAGGDMPAAARGPAGETGETLQWIRVASDGQVWALLLTWVDALDAETGRLVPVVEDAALAP